MDTVRIELTPDALQVRLASLGTCVPNGPFWHSYTPLIYSRYVYLLPHFIMTYTDKNIMEAVESSTSLRQVIQAMGLVPAGGNYGTIKRKIKELDLDTAHFLGQGHNKGKTKGNGYSGNNPEPLESILVKQRQYRSSFLRERLLKEGIFDHRCSSCNRTTWMDDPIPLELDHINGDNQDQRLENLRLLCPNCHALTPTYRGRNI